MRRKLVHVPGNRARVETTLRLERGEHLQVRCTGGRVRFNQERGSGPEVGPEGFPRAEFARRFPQDAEHVDPLTGPHDGHAGLMALLGERPFMVGAQATLCAPLGATVALIQTKRATPSVIKNSQGLTTTGK